MSKVIRVGEEVYKRLQELAEPLVDTPSTVIERLLDYYDNGQEDSDHNEVSTMIDVPTTTDVRGLYLVPASEENIRASIEKGVPFSVAETYIEKTYLEQLERALGGRLPFHPWAMTDHNRSKFKEMMEGDRVLLTVKGTGLFGYSARVLTKFRSERLGNAIWPIVPGLPWHLIYILGDIELRKINKEELVTALGYQPNYVVPGVIRVPESRVRRIIIRHGSLESFLDELDA